MKIKFRTVSRLFLLTLISFFLQSGYANKPSTGIVSEIPTEKILNMPCLIKPKDTPIVRSYLRTYMQLRREHSEVILGRTVLYFPIFEEKLRKHNMPIDLKYLSIVESALRPKAVSRVGAGGLWQFMPETGKHYGLHITEHRDDRSDPAMATEAAIAYLKNAFERFESWELAIASYNSGPGRVNRAVRRSRSKNFWKLKKYLPRETRAYVPGFIAATYLCNYYAEHGITPQYPSLDMQLTQTVNIYAHLSFSKIQNLTGLSRFVIEDLNPAYNSGFIPANSQGYTLTLPKRVMQSVLDYLAHLRPDNKQQDLSAVVSSITIEPRPVKMNTEDEYYRSVYYVNHGETLPRIAEMFGVSINNIMAWNNMSSEVVVKGQELTLYHPNKIERWSPFKRSAPAVKIPSLQINHFIVEEENKTLSYLKARSVKIAKTKKINTKMRSNKSNSQEKNDLTDIRGKYIMYKVQPNETLQDIADKFAGVRLSDLYNLNKIKDGNTPKVGSKLKIKKL